MRIEGINSGVKFADEVFEQPMLTEANYRQLFERVNHGLVLQDPNGVVLLCNERAETILGLSPHQLYGRSPLDPDWHAIHEDGLPFLGVEHPAIVALHTGQNVTDVIMGLRKPDGQLIWLSVNAYPLTYPDQAFPWSVFVSLTDVTDQIVAERERREIESRFRLIVENARELISIRDLNGNWVYVNPAIETLTGLTLTDIQQGNFLERVHPDNQHEIAQCKAGPISPFRLLNAANEWRWCEGARYPISEGSNQYRVSIVRDTTEHRQFMEQQLEYERLTFKVQKQEELMTYKNQFTSMVSHEFRNPLSSISMSAELLHLYGDRMSDSKRGATLDRITESVQRLRELLDDVLSISRAESASLEFETSALDLTALCQSLITKLQQTVRVDREIRLNVCGDPQPVEADAKLLDQAIGNLLSNAIKYSSPDTPIYLEIEFRQSQVSVKVTDLGIGIPELDKEKLFNAFYRASNVREINGTGLGLAIVKRVVDLHKGEIICNSVMGTGTSFTMTLPV
jgi:PAS domain S-box-containing protein